MASQKKDVQASSPVKQHPLLTSPHRESVREILGRRRHNSTGSEESDTRSTASAGSHHQGAPSLEEQRQRMSYLENHNVHVVLDHMLTSLLSSRPEDPMGFFLQYLREARTHAHRLPPPPSPTVVGAAGGSNFLIPRTPSKTALSDGHGSLSPASSPLTSKNSTIVSVAANPPNLLSCRDQCQRVVVGVVMEAGSPASPGSADDAATSEAAVLYALTNLFGSLEGENFSATVVKLEPTVAPKQLSQPDSMPMYTVATPVPATCWEDDDAVASPSQPPLVHAVLHVATDRSPCRNAGAASPRCVVVVSKVFGRPQGPHYSVPSMPARCVWQQASVGAVPSELGSPCIDGQTPAVAFCPRIDDTGTHQCGPRCQRRVLASILALAGSSDVASST